MANHVHNVKFIPNPVQKQFIESRAKADLFSSRMGEGKSAGLGWSAYYHTRHNPGARWALIRDTWENMQATTMKTFFEWFPPGVMGEFHATKKVFTWAEGVAKGEVEFLGMDDPADASKLMSRELAGFGIDEPAPAVGSAGVDEMIFDIGLTRLRQGGMKWYGCKLAENNPDEAHWTYRRFVSPGTDGFRVHQPSNPENEKNLPRDYYAQMRATLAHRPDLIRRFVDGEFGFQSEGKAVTPQWSDKIHLAIGLNPLPRTDLNLFWDFGHNPTCIIAQRTPMGSLLILDSIVGTELGVEELVEEVVKPLLADRYRGQTLRHIGDPQGKQREQTSIHRSASRYITKALGGPWRPGPVRIEERVEPLRAALSRTIGGRGLIQVDRDRAVEVWHALRGGWHYHVARTGVISAEPKKNIHSHPGDAMGYGVAIMYPLGKLMQKNGILTKEPVSASYYERERFTIGPQKAIIPPAHGSKLILPGGR